MFSSNGRKVKLYKMNEIKLYKMDEFSCGFRKDEITKIEWENPTLKKDGFLQIYKRWDYKNRIGKSTLQNE